MPHRREFLTTAAALASTSLVNARPQSSGRKHILVYTRSAGFQHDVVKKTDSRPCLVDWVFQKLAAENDFDIHCTKDGRIFLPESLAKFDAFFFYTTGDLTNEKSEDGAPPMPKEGKKSLIDAVASGKGIVGSHCASDTFHSRGDARQNQDAVTIDPFIAMLGGEFISHGEQQKSTMRVVNQNFPGLKGVSDFTLTEEWYSLKNFAPDLHVILAQETTGMKGADYERPAFPATWARKHGRGRVYYTSMGHRPDVWDNPLFQQILVGALNWATGRVDADIPPNLASVTPQATTMPPLPPPKPKK